MVYAALKRLSKHSLIYAAGPAAQKAIGFLLVPFVTAYIGTRGNYAVTEMAAVTLAVAGQVLGINLLHGMTRYYHDYESEEERARLVTTCLWLLAGTTGAALVAAWFLREPGAAWLFAPGEEYRPAFVALFAILFFQTVGQVGLRYLQILQRSVAYGALTTAKLVAEIGFKVLFMAGLGLTFMGVLYSVLAGEAVLALGVVLALARRLGLGFSLPMARRLARYALPLVLSGLCMFSVHQADRYVLKLVHGLDPVGVYGLGYKFGTVVNVVVLEAFGLIWFPFVFALRDREEVRVLTRRVATYLALLLTGSSLALALFSREVVGLMVLEEGLVDAWRVVPAVAGGYVFWGLFQIVHTGFFVRERTGEVALLVAGAAALNLALNLLLVPPLGPQGAAWATLATFAALAAAAAWRIERLEPVGFELGRLLAPIALAAGLCAVGLALPEGWPVAVQVGGKLALLALLPAFLLMGGYLRAEEKDKIAQIAGRLRARLSGRS